MIRARSCHRFFPVCWGCLLTLLIGVRPAEAQRELRDIPDPDPELERATFIVPEGFEVNLYASDPAIATPIQMNFDPDGRLWIASSEVYPQIEPGQVANDRILYVEDLDHDGTADQTTIFADGLLIPTGVVPGDGGVYVGASTELLHFRDTDGDGKADDRRIVLSGFGTEDTHHIIHTLRWGLEQRMYFNQSIYIHSHIETPWGVRRLNAGGVWQFWPRSMQLDVFSRGLVNQWGTVFDDHGVTFATDGAGGEGINYLVPGAYYYTAFGAERILQGLNPGSPKHCGLEVVYSSHLPDDWQGSLITNDFRGHRVCRFVVREEGAGFVSVEQQEVIRSDHVAFRPIDVKIGPDGALYIADWYNPIIQHGEVDFRDERRDHVHGRIWRVTFPERPLVEYTAMSSATNEELIGLLASPEMFQREHAKRVLVERGRDVLPEVRRWMTNLDNSTQYYHRHRLQALNVYQGLDVVEPELLYSLLVSRDPGARATATRTLGEWHERIPEAAEWLARKVHDEHPRVRLEAVCALRRIASPQSAVTALGALDHDMDRWIDYALWQTIRELSPVWHPALVRGDLDFSTTPTHLAFALKSAPFAEGVPILLNLLATGSVAGDAVSDVIDAVVTHGSPADLRQLLEWGAGLTDQPVAQVATLDGLIRARQQRAITPDGSLELAVGLLNSPSVDVQALSARCVGLWRVADSADELIALAERSLAEPTTPPHVFDHVALALADFQSPEAVEVLTNWQNEPRTARAAIEALLNIDPSRAATSAVDWMLASHPAESGLSQDDLSRLFRSFVNRQDGPALLAGALAGQQIVPDAAVIGLRVTSSTGQPFPELDAALTAAGGVITGPVVLSDAEMADMVAFVEANGDPHRGEQIFRRADLNCFKCHSIGDAGGIVGPNLVSLGATAQLDYLVNSLLDPNKNVKENFHTTVIATLDGDIISGIKVRESASEIVVRNAEDVEVTIPTDQVDEQVVGTSIMPTGLTQKLTREEMADLVAFLSALGRVPEFTVQRDPVVRRWLVMQPTDSARHQLSRTSYGSAAEDLPAFQWSPAYSRVTGSLPVGELPEMSIRNRTAEGARGVSFVRCEFDVTQAGAATLQFGDATGLSGWLDLEPLDLAASTPVELTPGRHRLTFVIDHNLRDSEISLRFETAESGAAVEIVGGGGK